MTHRRFLEHHLRSLAEIRDIMNSMKTLAYMETRKLARFLDTQNAVVRSIENVAADFLSFYPESLPGTKHAVPVYLLIGTQRGFCGDFNQALIGHLQLDLQSETPGSPVLIPIGRRLHTLLEKDTRVAVQIEGPSVVEEVTPVLGRVVDELSALQEQDRILNVYALYHGDEGNIVMRKLLPPFQHYRQQTPRFPYPPVLDQSPRAFLSELTEHYVFAALHEMLYNSMMAENHQRVTHLEGAVKHLDDQSAELERRCNTVRQEEIIEEIEVILLGARDSSMQSHPRT